jgi:hypothetical protein
MSKKYRYNSFDEAMEAIKEGRSLEEVRPDSITPELAMIAVKDWVYDLEFVPAHLQTLEMALIAVRWSPLLFQHVRPDLQTPEMALEAVKDRGWGLEHVPANCQTKEVIEAALKHDPSAKEFIKTKRLIKNALEEALGE